MLHLSLATLDTAEKGDALTIEHPIVVLMLVSCIITIVMVLFMCFGLLLAKRRKARENSKLGEKIGAAIAPLMDEISTQNQVLMQALIFAQANDKESKLALINLLKSAIAKDKSSVTEKVSKAIQDIDLMKKHNKEQAKEKVNNIVQEFSKDKKSIGGLSI